MPSNETSDLVARLGELKDAMLFGGMDLRKFPHGCIQLVADAAAEIKALRAADRQWRTGCAMHGACRTAQIMHELEPEVICREGSRE